MALKNEIDTASVSTRLADWLGGRVGGSAEVNDLVVPTSGGLSNETVLFDAVWRDGVESVHRALVARVAPTGPGVFRDYDLGKEAAVLRALHAETDVPVPEVLFHERDGSVFGAEFLVMERINGRVPSDDPPFTAGGWVLDLAPEERNTLFRNGLDALAKIHRADWRALGLEFLDTPAASSGLDAALANWREFFSWAAEGEANPTIEKALEWLDGHRPADEGGKVISWGDARVGNLMFGEDLSVTGVLDWEMVSLASPEVDLAWWLFLQRHHTEGIGLPLPEGVPTRDETIDYYASVCPGYTPANLEYYEILAATKLSIVMARAAHLMIGAGLLPPDAPMALSNPASNLLADMLGLPAPEGVTTTFIGNR
ncbi:phosphotransferase family protein [Mycolicibacterium sp. A43C]